MNQKNKIILITLIILVWGFLAFVFLKKDSSQPDPIEVKQPISTVNPIVEPENPTTTNSNLKTYRNEEWGFEFEYPSEWVISREIKSANNYSKYILFLSKPVIVSGDWGLDYSFVVNIVLPKFVDTAFWKSQENTSKIIVDGIEGTKYEYEYDGSQYVTVILPFGEYKIILGTGDGSKPYVEELNQILSSFKFMKK